jgi:hypothetical protein
VWYCTACCTGTLAGTHAGLRANHTRRAFDDSRFRLKLRLGRFVCLFPACGGQASESSSRSSSPTPSARSDGSSSSLTPTPVSAILGEAVQAVRRRLIRLDKRYEVTTAHRPYRCANGACVRARACGDVRVVTVCACCACIFGLCVRCVRVRACACACVRVCDGMAWRGMAVRSQRDAHALALSELSGLTPRGGGQHRSRQGAHAAPTLGAATERTRIGTFAHRVHVGAGIWAHPSHMCAGAGLTPAYICARTVPNLRQDWVGVRACSSAPRLGSPHPHLCRN